MKLAQDNTFFCNLISALRINDHSWAVEVTVVQESNQGAFHKGLHIIYGPAITGFFVAFWDKQNNK